MPIFDLMKKTGDINRMSMYNTFNMGIGMICVVAKENAEATLNILHEMGEEGYIIGKIISSEKEVEICLK